MAKAIEQIEQEAPMTDEVDAAPRHETRIVVPIREDVKASPEVAAAIAEASDFEANNSFIECVRKLAESTGGDSAFVGGLQFDFHEGTAQVAMQTESETGTVWDVLYRAEVGEPSELDGAIVTSHRIDVLCQGNWRDAVIVEAAKVETVPPEQKPLNPEAVAAELARFKRVDL